MERGRGMGLAVEYVGDVPAEDEVGGPAGDRVYVKGERNMSARELIREIVAGYEKRDADKAEAESRRTAESAEEKWRAAKQRADKADADFRKAKRRR